VTPVSHLVNPFSSCSIVKKNRLLQLALVEVMSKKTTDFYQLPVDLSWFLTLPLSACILSLAWSTLPLASWED
jgi:hypothetical protein